MSTFSVIVVVFLLEASVVIAYPENVNEKEEQTPFFPFSQKTLVTRVGGRGCSIIFEPKTREPKYEPILDPPYIIYRIITT